MSQALRLLSIGAHPADVFDQCAGTMAHHAARGDYIACCVLTHGTRVHDTVISDEMQHRAQIPEGEELLRLMAERKDVKAEEIRAAGRILGFSDIYFLGADDDVLLATRENVTLVARVIRQVKPDVILTHSPWEGDGVTGQHCVTGQIVMRALAFANGVDAGDRNPPHRVAQVFFFGQGAAAARRWFWDARGGYYNNVFVDITDVIDKKLAAMDCLVSQGYAGAYSRKILETNDGAFGGRYAYGEGFISMKAENHYFLPVTDMMLDTARLSDQELMRRYSWRLPVEEA